MLSPSLLPGGTPLAALQRLGAALGLQTHLVAKLEQYNPTGSVKDRAAHAILRDAFSRGVLRSGGVVIEASSGSLGIALSAAATVYGCRAVITMPETMSAERRSLLRAYGAEVVLTDGARGMAGALDAASAIARKTPDSFLADQFRNPANPRAHYETTGPELWADTHGTLDFFVAGVGSGGTIGGVGRYLKEQKPSLRVVAVEPAASPVLGGGKPGPHGIQGIGAGFVPAVLDRSVCDEVIAVTDEDAFSMCRTLARCEGLLVGPSSGAALHAAVALSRREENAGKTVAVLLPDGGERYLSTGIFDGM